MTKILMALAALAASASLAAFAAQPPAGATGQCKDGSYTTAQTRRGACSDHGGVKKWMAERPAREKARRETRETPSAKRETPARERAQRETRDLPSAKRESTERTAPARNSTAREDRAPDNRAERMPRAGGNDRVWVNTASGVYHCPGGRWYGKTKQGEYMTEREARERGDRPDHGKSCTG